LRQKLLQLSFPVRDLSFDPHMMHRGLVLDVEKGNILKTNRFGYVKMAYHGTKPMDFKAQQLIYSRTIISLAEKRYVFLNTLFSLSEGCMYAQLVDLLDEHKLPAVLGYQDLYALVRESLNAAHMEGQLKAEIIADPDRFVVLDPDTPLALLDQSKSGKKVMLITNSEWSYTAPMMSYAFDRFLPDHMTWRSLFDIIIVSAHKPEFFLGQPQIFEVLEDSGHLIPITEGLQSGKVYYGGSAKLIESYLKLSGDQILYVGDHIFTDVHVSKNIRRWRTGLILRELENEINGTKAFAANQTRLVELMNQKRALEFGFGQLKLKKLRLTNGYFSDPKESNENLEAEIKETLRKMHDLDQQIIPIVEESATIGHPKWGLMMQAGNDKSLLASQVERYADIYMSRVSNFLFQSPYIYLRSPRGRLPHDIDLPEHPERLSVPEPS
jgi:HAD superfamily 5'-nucleotidase-like hydrolase